MIISAVGSGSMKIREALLRLAQAERDALIDGRVTASIVRVEVVKKDAAGNIIERIVDGDNR